MKKLIVVAMLSTITMTAFLFSCSGDDAVTPAPSNLVSGVFLGDTIPINDTTMLQVDLSVDELTDGTVNGGLWVSWLYTTQLRERERVLHQLSLTHMPDGQTVHFNGTASITNPPPGKTIDQSGSRSIPDFNIPYHIGDSSKIAGRLSKYKVHELARLLESSSKIAELTYDRYQFWSQDLNLNNAKQTILTFKGDVITGLNAESFSDDDLRYANNHLIF